MYDKDGWTYGTVAPQVCSRVEMLTQLTHEISRLLQITNRALELETDVRTTPDTKENSIRNSYRSMVKRSATTIEAMAALNLLPEQVRNNQWLNKAATEAIRSQMLKMSQWHMSEISDFGQNVAVVQKDPEEYNPMHAANEEDFS